MIEAGPLMRVRLDLSYEGTDFAGWARQPGQRTVQCTVEEALRTLLRTPAVALTVAGRTDAGVHARGQVAHCDIPRASAVDIARESAAGGAGDGLSDLARRLARLLPPDVRVTGVRVVARAFDARFSALWRRYVYAITDDPAGADPMRRREVLAWPRPLDVDAMQAAAQRLVGLHDFAAYCRRRDGASTIRTLESIDVQRSGYDVSCTIRADAFCHSMVRSIVGALIAVGDGRRPVEWPASLLSLGQRADDVTVAPPHGLTLAEVGYPPDDQLAARAEQARARRG